MDSSSAASSAASGKARPHVLTLPFVYNRVVSFLCGAADLPAVGALLCAQRACLHAFLADERSDGRIKRVFDAARASAPDDTARTRSRLLFGRALATWPHAYNPSTPGVPPTPTPWRGRAHHDAWGAPRLLVAAAETTRVHAYNGQTLRTRGGGIVAVGRRAGRHFSVDSDAGTRADPVHAAAPVASDPQDPITQVAVYGDTVYTIQRSGKGMLLRAASKPRGGGGQATGGSSGGAGAAGAAAPGAPPLRPLGRVKLAKEKRPGIRRVFGSDFLDDSTLFVGTCNKWGGRTGVNNTFQEFKVTESAVVRTATWDCTRSPADGDNLQGSLLVPTFADSCCASVTTSSVRIFDVRQRALALRFPILRTTMGPNGPARAQFGHESTYLAMLHDTATHVYDVRRTPALGAPGAGAAAPLAGKLSKASLLPVQMPFVAGRKPMCLCWMPVATGFQIATSVSTGEILIHDISRSGFHVGTLFPGGGDKSPTTSVQCWEEGLVAQSANGAVRLLYGRTSSALAHAGNGLGHASSCPVQ